MVISIWLESKAGGVRARASGGAAGAAGAAVAATNDADAMAITLFLVAVNQPVRWRPLPENCRPAAIEAEQIFKSPIRSEMAMPQVAPPC